MIVHLLESTLLLAIAILIAHVPRLAARTRYTIVFAALMKFAIPSAIVPRFLAALGIDLTGMKGTIVITALGPLSMATLPQSAAPIWPMIVIAIWAAIAIALLARSFMRGRAAVRLALSDAVATDDDALLRARERAGVAKSIRLLRSPSIATPATVGLLHPIIVIPADTQLAGGELETILTHECAHIARRDNLLSVVESIAGSALWFHPLVWIARRVLDAAREEACDAVVLTSGDTNTYVTALGKVCGAAIAPTVTSRRAGISCIVSNTIQERMRAIMRFGTRSLFPHRAVTTAVIALIAIATIGSGVARALPSATDDTATSPYKIDVSAIRVDSLFDFFITIRNRTDDTILNTARVRSHVEEWGTMQWGHMDPFPPDGRHKTMIRVKGHADGTATVETVIDGSAPIVQTIAAKSAHAVRKVAKKSDENISIDLKDADIRDVFRTLSKLTNIEIIVDDDVDGRVTVTLTETPWTEALETILRTNNLRQERIGNTIYIHRK
ncbi:MAG TPA: M56 family metallopeptidase [Thermoanaerobaculia bacterium]|jgi:beta-lactamase regulating signal transducer with metallopeptidase domain|nr:M56 family metallopeptidase [Thermoanaerobaculia bacterium]